MKQFSYEILTKFESFIILIFLTTSVFFFSTVSPLAKLYIFSLILVLLFGIILSFFLNNSVLAVSVKVLISVLVLFVYIYFNTFFAKVRFEAKIEQINFILYLCTFLMFSMLQSYLVTKVIKTSFLITSVTFLTLYILFGERIIYFFVYNPNIAAGYCLAMILWVFGYVKQEKEIDFIHLTILCSSVLMLILLKNFSSVFIVLSLIIYKIFKTKPVAIFVVVSLAIISIVFNFSSFVDRIIWNIIGTRVWFKNFLFGVGLGGFKFLYPSYLKDISILPSIATIFVHNYFLHLCSEMGILGLLIFLYFLYIVLNESKNLTTYTYPVYGMLIHNLVDYNLLIPQNSILFFTFLGLLQQGNAKVVPLKKNIFVIILAIVFTLIGFLQSFKLQKIFTLVNSNKVEDLYKATELDRTCWYALRKLGLESVKENDIYKAKKMFTETLQVNPYDSESWFYSAVISFKLNEEQKAYMYLKTAILLQPMLSNKYIRMFKTL